MENKRILFIGAHTDDIEYCAGGTMFKLKENNEIHCIAFSKCSDSVPERFSKDVLKHEFESAMLFLNPKSFKLYDFQVRKFPEHRQAILEILYKVNKELNPDVIFCVNDNHQDHKVIGEECERAFRRKTLINFAIPKNGQKHNMAVSLRDSDVLNKLKLTSYYKSQEYIRGNNEDQDRIIMQYNGYISGNENAELFYINYLNYE